MPSMRGEATNSYDDKLRRMGVGGPGQKIRTAQMGDSSVGHSYAQTDGTMGEAQGVRAAGYEDDAAIASTIAGKAAKPRIDRPGYKNGGAVKGKRGTTVNVIIAPQGGGGGEPPPPAMPAGGPPPMPMPPPGPMAGPPGAMPMPRKNGGRVKYTGGALGARGRLEKVSNYGDAAYPGGKAKKP